MKKIIAKNGNWLTQRHLSEFEQRIFSTDVYTPDNSNDEWVEVSNEWKLDWEESHPLDTPPIETFNESTIDDIEEIREESDPYKYDKERVINKLLEFDKSERVNTFTLNGVETWFSKDDRLGLLARINSEESVGKTITTLWYENNSILISIEKLKDMLYKLELYASKVYDRTQEHIENILSLTSFEGIQHYNYYTGYPEKLEFNIKDCKNILDIEN